MADRQQESTSIGIRDLFLRAVVAAGVAGFAITEVLGAFGAIRRIPLLLCWMAVVAGAVFMFRSRPGRLDFRIRKTSRDPVVAICVLGTEAILALTAITAALSPPNSWDALAYHMPRVVYWAEQGSVRFFPTAYLNQITLQPLAEYFMLHSYVLSGGDRLVNFVQWFGSLGSIVGVSSLGGLLGAGRRGQAIAALFCATLPSGILASSSAKNDYFMAMWLVASVYFAARFVRSSKTSDALACGAALGLALVTKATAYLFAPWLLIAVVATGAIPRARALTSRVLAGFASAVILALLLALLINTPQYARNFQLSGSILGFDSPYGDGLFRWKNDTFGWRQTYSNILRNVSDQLGGRGEKWNRQVYAWTLRAHQRLGIDINDPATTWRFASFAPPQNTNHEANANSKWHILILWLATVVVARRAWRTRNIAPLLYAAALFCGFVAFCAYLKWQPYEARLFLPLLVAASPLAGLALDYDPRGFPLHPHLVLQIVLCIFLLSTARRPALENWLRPLEGPASVFRVARDDRYFTDIAQLHNAAAYQKSAQLLATWRCQAIAIDSTNLPLEYPLMALLREQQPGTTFVHAGVQNASRRLRPPVPGAPCAVVCLDCAGDQQRQALYSSRGATQVNEFIIFR